MVRLLQWIVSGKKEIRKLAELNIKSMGRGGFLPVGTCLPQAGTGSLPVIMGD